MEEYFDCNGDTVKAIAEKNNKSKLTFETALPYYEKLIGRLAVNTETSRSTSWGCMGVKEYGDILERRVYQIKWMPKLREGYLRPSYRVFCIAYGIKVEVKE